MLHLQACLTGIVLHYNILLESDADTKEALHSIPFHSTPSPPPLSVETRAVAASCPVLHAVLRGCLFVSVGPVHVSAGFLLLLLVHLCVFPSVGLEGAVVSHTHPPITVLDLQKAAHVLFSRLLFAALCDISECQNSGVVSMQGM